MRPTTSASTAVSLSNISLRRFSSASVPSNSEIIEILSQLKKTSSTSSINVEDVSRILKHQALADASSTQQLWKKAKLSDADLATFYNSLIKGFAKTDFSIAAVASNALSTLPPSAAITDLAALIEIVKYNPGRVASSWEVFIDDIHGKTHITKVLKEDRGMTLKLTEEVVRKLLLGDLCDIEEGILPDTNSLAKILYIIQWSNTGASKISQETQKLILQTVLDLHCPWILEKIDLSPDILIETLRYGETLTFLEFGYIIRSFWKQKQEIQDYSILSVLLKPLAQICADGLKWTSLEKTALKNFELACKNLELESSDIAISSEYFENIWSDIQKIIQTHELDIGTEAEVVQLRSTLLTSIGIYKRDLEGAEALFESYVVQAQPFLDQLKSELAIVYSYHSCLTRSLNYWVTANRLIESFKSPATNTLQALILAVSFNGDTESALALFNKHISSASRQISPSVGTSPAGMLTESLILGHLCNLDREFAYLISEGATENGILSDESASNRVKRLFKLYGKAFEEDDEAIAKTIMEQLVLSDVKKL